MNMPTHQWIAGGNRHTRDVVRSGLGLPVEAERIVVDAHRNRRGPYTAAGEILRRIVPDLQTGHADLLERHAVEILTAAPELRSAGLATRHTLTSLAIPTERTRFYSRLRTERIAHGLAQFFLALADRDAAPACLVIENLHAADPTDTEFTEIVLRRLDPARTLIVVGSDDSASGSEHAVKYQAGPAVPAEPGTAREYVWADGTIGLPTAYADLPEDDRQRLHDERADELEARDEESLRLGAIPFHRERGSDPEKCWEALEYAVDTCLGLGFYHATIDLAERGRALVGWDEPRRRFLMSTRLTTSLSVLDRAAEAEVFYDEMRRSTDRPRIHMNAAYATAMLYTRQHAPELKDHDRARAWINQAVAFASTEPDPKERAFETVFMRNGLALVEVHAKRPEEALRLVDEGIAELDAVLAPDEHRLHRSVLRHNRGQVYAALGRLEEAIADFTTVIEADPNFAEYWFDRGDLLRRAGRYEAALSDYTKALSVSPPFAEIYYNRGDLLLSLGETEAALADLDQVIALDPTFVDAYVNRAGIRLTMDDHEGAEADARVGLNRDPGNAHLLAVLAQVHLERGETAEARAVFDQVLEMDDAPSAAWAGRASLRFEEGDHAGALDDLECAVELAPEDPATLYNRAIVLRDLGHHDRAGQDLREAQRLAPDDEDIAVALHDLAPALA